MSSKLLTAPSNTPPLYLPTSTNHVNPMVQLYPLSLHPDNQPQPSLTADQEMALLLIPEQFQAHIVAMLTSKETVHDHNNKPIRTVDDAWGFVQHYSTAAAKLTKIDVGPSTAFEAEPDSTFEAQVAAANSVSAEPVVKSEKSIGYAKYVEACRNRKARLIQLRMLIIQARARMHSQRLVAETPEIAAFNIWANEQRKQCEDYIARKRPIGLESLVSEADIVALESELAHLKVTVPQRADFM